MNFEPGMLVRILIQLVEVHKPRKKEILAPVAKLDNDFIAVFLKAIFPILDKRHFNAKRIP